MVAMVGFLVLIAGAMAALVAFALVADTTVRARNAWRALSRELNGVADARRELPALRESGSRQFTPRPRSQAAAAPMRAAA